MLPGKEILLLFVGSFLLHLTKAGNTKHMYALCPPDFFGIGTECYHISQKKQNWLDAHFDCKDRKSRLAEPNRYEDRMIRRFLVNNDFSNESKWIGGNYNWAKKKWQWQDGKEFVYQSFSQMPGRVEELQYHCAILNPSLKYRWSASSCVEKHHYICQHRMPFVNEKHRSRIYARWNQTYPNEEATQVEVVLNGADMLRRGHRQSTPVNGRSTNTQRLFNHRNYLANQWLRKYRSQQIVINRNAVPNEINLNDAIGRRVPQRPNRLSSRRRNPSIGRDDFIQFEKKKKIARGPLLTNRVDDFEKPEHVTQAPFVRTHEKPMRHQDPVEVATSPVSSVRTHETPTRRQDPVEVATSPVTSVTSRENPTRRQDPVEVATSPPRRHKANKAVDVREKKRLEETRRLLETGRFENSYTRQTISTTTSTPTTTEAYVNTEDSERIEMEQRREFESRRQQEEEQAEQRRREEEIRQNEIRRRDELRRREEERQKMEEKRLKEQQEEEEKRIEEERLQNQINEETLRIEQEKELRRLQIEEEERRRDEETRRIHEEHLRDREEKMRLRELELKQREEEEQRLREDEERRQEENRKLLEEVERQQREQEEKKRQEAERERVEEENRRRKKEELRQRQKMKENQTDDSYEDEVLRIKEKNRRDKIAKLKERIKNLSPEDQLKFWELRGKRTKKHNSNKENETTTDQL